GAGGGGGGGGGGAAEKEERDPSGAVPAVLPLLERGDDTGARRNRPVVEDRARLVVGGIGELEVAGHDAPWRDGAGLTRRTLRDVRGARRRRRHPARQAGAALGGGGRVGERPG